VDSSPRAKKSRSDPENQEDREECEAEIIMDEPEGKVYPVLPIRDVVLFPGVIIPLFVGRPRSLKALENALLHDKKIFVVTQKKMQSWNALQHPSDGAYTRHNYESAGRGHRPNGHRGLR